MAKQLFYFCIKICKATLQRRRIKIAIARFCVATVHAKYSAKPFKSLAKATLLQSDLSASTLVFTLKYTLNTLDFLLAEMAYQPLFTVFEPSQRLERWY